MEWVLLRTVKRNQSERAIAECAGNCRRSTTNIGRGDNEPADNDEMK